MVSHDRQSWEGSISSALYNDSRRDMEHRGEVRPRSGPRLLDLFPQTSADKPSTKRSCFGQEGLPMSQEKPGVALGSRDHDLCALSLSNHPTSRSLLGETTALHPYVGSLQQLSKKRRFLWHEELQMGEADKRKPLNMTESELGSQDQALCALTLSTYSASGSSGYVPEQVTSLNPHQEVTSLSTWRVPVELESPTRELDVLLQPEPANLCNARQLLSFQAESTSLSNRRDVPDNFTRSLRTLRNTILTFVGTTVPLVAQPVGAISNQVTPPSLQQPEGQARAQPAPPQVHARVGPPAEPQVQESPGQARPRTRLQQSKSQAAQQQVHPTTQHGHPPMSSSFKGVTYYKRTRRWEANFWNKGSQTSLGASSTENQAARAYDRATIHFRGVNAKLNFPLADYAAEVLQLQALTDAELVTMLRKQSVGKGTLYPEYPNP